MKSKEICLLKAFLKSTSLWNAFRYSKEKRGKIIGNLVGVGIIQLLIMGYCIAAVIGYGMMGIMEAAPMLTAMIISLLSFVFTLFKTNGYLFGFKEYDMIMSLPFASKTIVSCKFLYMYIKSLPWYGIISLPVMVVYGVFEKPGVLTYILWILLTLFLPVVPMLVASAIGFLIVKFSAGYKKKNIMQTVLMMIVVLFAFSLQFILQNLFQNEDMEVVLQGLAETTQSIGTVYAPAAWFSNSVIRGSIADILLLVGVSILTFELVMVLVGKSYKKINSSLKTHAASKQYKMSALKKSNLAQAIAFKEFKRLLGSATYMTNAAIGDILCVVFGVVVLIFGFDNIITVVLRGAPIDTQILQPAIPLVVYFFVGMVATTAISPSLEGKNFWIVQSLPIETKVLYQGKMLFNMYLTVPAMLFSVGCICISAGVSILSAVLYFILGIALCCFSTTWGCVCGRKYMRLDWENEIEVVKQGTAVTVYLLPNMFVTMGLIVLVVFLGTKMDANLILLLLTAIVSVLAYLCYLIAKRGS